ncbi:uncharacterized protein si:ch1073-357b18.4 isoform X1 [Anguilla rostrata]|uniref:uncharacterized protein si:ch1073-357b18.4 isoform X1 n=1 Tax=Anguilla anguilla TaxID=7936 RepID=UPI0015ABB19B|nr:uncharacterized protein si:ch1073-357b18.4 isoform X1 [Anguilla anguilla]
MDNLSTSEASLTENESSQLCTNQDESSQLCISQDGSVLADPGSDVSGGEHQDHLLQSVQMSTASAPILLYPVSADRVISTTSTDGKTIFKIAPGVRLPAAPLPNVKLPAAAPEKVSTSEFTYQTIVYLIEAVGRRWNMYGSRERAQLFHSVQKELESQGYCLPVERIRRKWNNLIVTYKRVKDRSRETGQAKTSWEYFEMMDAMLGSTIGTQCTANSSAALVDMANVTKETAVLAEQAPPRSMSTMAKPGLLPGGLITTCAQIPTLIPSSLPPPITLNTSSKTPSNTDARHPAPSPSRKSPARLGRLRVRQKLRRGPADTAASFLAQQHSHAEERTSLLRSFLTGQEERHRAEEERGNRSEARERRREKREGKMVDAMGRMATALELISSKQDTIITLLQRLADRQ